MRTIIFCFFLMSSLFAYNERALATGASYIDVMIKPIAKNKNGDILCKTSFRVNPTGGHYSPDIEYGLCVITNDTILEYPVFVLKGDHHGAVDGDYWYDQYREDVKGWTDWLNDSVGVQKTVEEKVLIKEFKFKENTLSKYERSDTISVADFEKQRGIHFQEKKLLSLKSGKSSTDCTLSDSIIIVYDFGNIVITQNELGYESDPIGFCFDYNNLWEPGGMYECYGITGVLTLSNKRRK